MQIATESCTVSLRKISLIIAGRRIPVVRVLWEHNDPVRFWAARNVRSDMLVNEEVVLGTIR